MVSLARAVWRGSSAVLTYNCAGRELAIHLLICWTADDQRDFCGTCTFHLVLFCKRRAVRYLHRCCRTLVFLEMRGM